MGRIDIVVNFTRYSSKGYFDRYDEWRNRMYEDERGGWVKFKDIEDILKTSTNMQGIPFSFDEIKEEFKSFAKSSYDYSLYSCGAIDMFNFIVAKLNSTRLQ